MSRNDSRSSDPRRRWFDLAGTGEDYERRFVDQLKGLDILWQIVPGREVLDLGCAEGLIALECLRKGAKLAMGVEIVNDRVIAANHLAEALKANASFHRRDLDRDELPNGTWDISLALAIAHKLKNPDGFLRRVAERTRYYIVLRLPAGTDAVILDQRSGGQPFDTRKILPEVGFALFAEARGHHDEWVGYFVRGQ